MRVTLWITLYGVGGLFPFLFGGTFIEGIDGGDIEFLRTAFPFLFGGTFIEGANADTGAASAKLFPFLFGGTFIEGSSVVREYVDAPKISLPFRRDFH